MSLSLNAGVTYGLRLLAFFLFTLVTALLSLPLLLGVVTAVDLVYAPCSEGGATPSDYGLAWQDVTLPARIGGQFRGFYIPGPSGAAVIIPPTGSNGRSGRLAEAAMLAQNGYTVLLYESRRCAGMGPLSLGYLEVAEVGDALDFLLAQDGVDPARIGVYGFSTAGATSIMAAAELPQLQAVIAEGGYGDFINNALLRHENDRLSAYFLDLHHWSLRQSYRLLIGLDLSQLSPVRVIDRIAPRPILLIYGSEEISRAGAVDQQAAAGTNADLWIVEGAGHGGYRAVAGEVYERRVVGFFDRGLGN
jgi:dipeptidyl aminopeptidase/acylaminoacyl peptidase